MKNRQIQARFQILDQLVERRRADRVEPRRRFVKEQQFRIQRQPPWPDRRVSSFRRKL